MQAPSRAKCLAGKSYFAGNRYRRCRCACVTSRLTGCKSTNDSKCLVFSSVLFARALFSATSQRRNEFYPVYTRVGEKTCTSWQVNCEMKLSGFFTSVLACHPLTLAKTTWLAAFSFTSAWRAHSISSEVAGNATARRFRRKVSSEM